MADKPRKMPMYGDEKAPVNQDLYFAISDVEKLPADELKEMVFAMGACHFPCELSIEEAKAVEKAFKWILMNHRREFPWKYEAANV